MVFNMFSHLLFFTLCWVAKNSVMLYFVMPRFRACHDCYVVVRYDVSSDAAILCHVTSMVCYVTLCCVMLFCFVLSYVLLFIVMLLYCAMYSMVCHIILCYVVMLCRVMLCSGMFCSAIYYVMSCFVM